VQNRLISITNVSSFYRTFLLVWNLFKRRWISTSIFHYYYFKNTSSLYQKILIVKEYIKAGKTFHNHCPAGKKLQTFDLTVINKILFWLSTKLQKTFSDLVLRVHRENIY